MLYIYCMIYTFILRDKNLVHFFFFICTGFNYTRFLCKSNILVYVYFNFKLKCNKYDKTQMIINMFKLQV